MNERVPGEGAAAPGPTPPVPTPTPPSPQPPRPQPPRQVNAPTEDSTGDAEIDAALAALSGTDPEDLDAALAAGGALHDLLRERLNDAAE